MVIELWSETYNHIIDLMIKRDDCKATIRVPVKPERGTLVPRAEEGLLGLESMKESYDM